MDICIQGKTWNVILEAIWMHQHILWWNGEPSRTLPSIRPPAAILPLFSMNYPIGARDEEEEISIEKSGRMGSVVDISWLIRDIVKGVYWAIVHTNQSIRLLINYTINSCSLVTSDVLYKGHPRSVTVLCTYINIIMRVLSRIPAYNNVENVMYS